MLRARLLHLIRSLGGAHALDRLRYAFATLKNARKNRDFRQIHPEFALPPDYLMYESFRLDYSAYYRSGREAAGWLSDHFANHRSRLERPRILDWGCGPARVLRHLPAFFGQEGRYVGVDPNVESIRWIQQHIDFIEARSITQAAKLDFPNETFDFIYGISILTHLPAPAHEAWLTEISRILAPDGILLLTTHGPAYQGKLTSEEKAQYERGEIVIRGGVQTGHRVFTAYQPPSWMKTLFAKLNLKVLNYVPGRPRDWGIEQDTWVLGKNGSGL